MLLDHIELLVADRDAAAAWYDQWLGFKVMPEHADWAAHGPLMLTNDAGRTMLALFLADPSAPAARAPAAGWRRVAFRADAAEFQRFEEGFRTAGGVLEGPVDHDRAWSLYFSDPWGNQLELTTYDYALVAEQRPRK